VIKTVRWGGKPWRNSCDWLPQLRIMDEHQYAREDALLDVIDRFFATHIFGPERLERFRGQHASLIRELASEHDNGRERMEREIADLDRRIEMQIEAIEAGVDAALVSARIDKLKQERRELESALASTERERRDNGLLDFDDACKLLDSLPRLDGALAEAGLELRRSVFDAFRLSAAIDRNAGQIRLKALVSSAFGEAGDLQELVANGTIAGAGFEPATFGL
jgi:hypothetical protein